MDRKYLESFAVNRPGLNTIRQVNTRLEAIARQNHTVLEKTEELGADVSVPVFISEMKKFFKRRESLHSHGKKRDRLPSSWHHP